MTIHTARQYSYALLGDAQVAEISLDEGVIMAGGRTVGFRELEAELLPAGTRAELDALIEHLQARFALIPESRGKKKRGLALLEQATADRSAGPRLHPSFEAVEQVDLLPA